MDNGRRGFLILAGTALFGGVALMRRSLSAVSSPKQKWAMAVDVRKCASRPNCTACREACHAAHNVPCIGSVKEEIKWIWKEPFEQVFPERVHPLVPAASRVGNIPVLCNHCDNPPCIKVCPTKATWRRGDGIVMMDMHRCIGCRYCMAACPYGSRSFNFRDPLPYISKQNPAFPCRAKGVVEKCNFCEDRLRVQKAPACVEAGQAVGCNALVFGDLLNDRSEITRLLSSTNVATRNTALGTLPKVFYLL